MRICVTVNVIWDVFKRQIMFHPTTYAPRNVLTTYAIKTVLFLEIMRTVHVSHGDLLHVGRIHPCTASVIVSVAFRGGANVIAVV